MHATALIAFDWQSWVACGLGLLAVLHLSKRWWPKRRSKQAHVSGDGAMTCAVKAPGACGGGGCGGCGSAEAPVRVHRRTSHDTLGRTPGH